MIITNFVDPMKPLPGAQLNRQDPQGKKLVAGWMFWEGSGSRSTGIWDQRDATIQLNTILWGGGQKGRGSLRTETATASTTPGVAITMPALTRYAIECRAQRITASNTYSCVCTEGASRGCFLNGTVGGSVMNFFETTDHFGTTTLPFGSSNHLVWTTNGGSQMDYYIDGQLDTQASFSVPTFTPNSLFNDSASEDLIGVLEWLRIFEELNAADVLALYEDPFKMFRTLPDVLTLVATGMMQANSYFFFFR